MTTMTQVPVRAITNRFLGRCHECILPIAREIAWQGNYQRVGCPSCGRPVQLQRVSAVVNEEQFCDSSCMAATGSECVCDCGGENHGCDWLKISGVSLIGNLALETYRDKINKLRAPRVKREPQ